MSDIRKVIYTLLTADAGVSALVSTKVYPVRAPQTTTAPYITWHVINSEPFGTKKSATDNGQSKVDRFSLQINCFATDYTQTTNIGEAVRDAIDRVADQTISGVAINGVDYNGEHDDYDDEVNLHFKILEYSIRRKN